MRTNTELLARLIEESGLRLDYIQKRLGLSRQGFWLKRSGKRHFTEDEMNLLCELLNIKTKRRKIAVFFADLVD